MMGFWNRIFRRDRPADRVPEMAEMLANTADVEIGCDEVHDLLDQYADAVASGQDPRALLPLVHHHLGLCKDCREELEALLRAIQGTGKGDL